MDDLIGLSLGCLIAGNSAVSKTGEPLEMERHLIVPPERSETYIKRTIGEKYNIR